ncbi:hypothetical protein BDQ17DRAFT_1260740, partial [Cyathus striatus]
LPMAYAIGTEQEFPMLKFSQFSQFIEANFGSKISLSTVIFLLLSLTSNVELLNLHARQQYREGNDRRTTTLTAWINALSMAVTSSLGSKTKYLFQENIIPDHYNDDDINYNISAKLDAFSKFLKLHPYNETGHYIGELGPVSETKLTPVRMICPSFMRCNGALCDGSALTQNSKYRDIPKVTLIEGTKMYHESYILTGSCSKCKSIYYADHKHISITGQRPQKEYLNKARYFKIGTHLWVDRVFSKAIMHGIYSFHASAAAYAEYWSNSFGNNIEISCKQIWHAFIDESIRTVSLITGRQLTVDDHLPINEITHYAFEHLGANGIVKPPLEHSCLECTQKYKSTADNMTNYRSNITTENFAPVKMVVVDGVVMGPTVRLTIIVVEYSADIITYNMDPNVVLRVVMHKKLQVQKHVRLIKKCGISISQITVQQSYFSPNCYYCVETVCAPCGVVIAWKKFVKSESTANIMELLNMIYPIPDSRPAYICIDKACLVLCSVLKNILYRPWLLNSRFVVDGYHYTNHKADDDLCRTFCNPAPSDGSAPNLVIIEHDQNGQPYYKRAFNTQACEQLNSWLGGFESILKQMTVSNFNWFLHAMLVYHTQHVLDRQQQREMKTRLSDDLPEDMDVDI